jgi:A/G-specific adenine glycosylase
MVYRLNLIVMSIVKDQKNLIEWYLKNKRDLPWRKSKDPYKIWISEVMLQQTTVTTVIPYFNRFISRFENIQSLATSPEDQVLEMWSGLGYYSRARNLHKAAKEIQNLGRFPNSADQLLQLSGFGPYTSRAVASIAFSERVGVLDGNVIRVLSRFYGLKTNWWESSEKAHLQKLADQLANSEFNSEINQGLMELGATICTPKKVMCLLCPWNKKCVAFSENWVNEIPLQKPKQKNEIWHWTLFPKIKNNKIQLSENSTIPFLKKMYFPIGTAKKSLRKPLEYDIKHTVTKYQIFITLNTQSSKTQKSSIAIKDLPALSEKWIDLKNIKKINPTSLMTKIIRKLEEKNAL